MREPTVRPAPADYLSDLERCFAAARDSLGGRDLEVVIAGQGLRLRFAGEAMADQIAPAFAHLPPARAGAEPDMEIDIWDAETSAVKPPRAPFSHTDVDGIGDVAGFNEGRIRTACDLGYGAITVVDLDRRKALFSVPAATRVPWYERAAPLRPALHWLLEPGGCLVHAGSVGRGDRGALIVGRSGSGKSTLATAALLGGMQFAGDDYVVLTDDGAARAHAVHGTSKLTTRSLELLPALGVTGPPDPLPNSKTVVDLHSIRPGQVCASLEIRAIVAPEVSAEGPAWSRIRGAAGMLALAPSTMLQLPGRDSGAMRQMAALARTVPSYALALGPDPTAAASALEEVLADAP